MDIFGAVNSVRGWVLFFPFGVDDDAEVEQGRKCFARTLQRG